MEGGKGNGLLRWLPPAVFVLVPSALILPILLSGKILYGADVVSVFQYSRIVIADAFRSGRLPIWDPHVMAGFPMLAEPQNAIFYPPTWACVFLSAGAFWTWSAWGHLVLAGFFAHRWLERGLGVRPMSALVGASVFMMSGFLSGHLLAGHVNYVWAYPWIPALLWRLERFLAGPSLRRGLLLSAVLAMLFLAGVPQFVFFAGLMILARLVHFVLFDLDGRKARMHRSAKAVAWLLLGLAFCAPQLLPTLELTGQMHRGNAGSTTFFTQYALDPRQLGDLFLVAPTLERFRYTDASWCETCGYVGGAGLLLGLAAYAGKHAQRHLWSGVALFGVLLALGDVLPLYDGFVAVVPGAGWFRGPGRYLLLFTVGMAALVGIGFDALWSLGPRSLRLLGGLLGGAAAFQLVRFAAPCYVGEPSPPALATWVTGKVLRRPSSRLDQGLPQEFWELCGMEGRIGNAEPSVLLIGQCQAAGLDHVGGYEPMMLRRYTEAINAARGVAADVEMVIVASVAPHPVIRMLATRILAAESRENQGSMLTIYPDPMPRSWIVNNAVVIEDKEERLRTMAYKPWDPRRTLIFESYPMDPPPVPTEKPAGTARVIQKEPGFYEIAAETQADGYLVLSEAYYPGWTSTVDGKAADLLPANHLIQTVRLPAGKHVVRFQYRSRFLGLGFAVAALAFLVPVGLLVGRHRRQLPLQRLPGAP